MNTRKYIEVRHTPHANYKLFCSECGEFGDWVGITPIKFLFDRMDEHIKEKKHGN